MVRLQRKGWRKAKEGEEAEAGEADEKVAPGRAAKEDESADGEWPKVPSVCSMLMVVKTLHG